MLDGRGVGCGGADVDEEQPAERMMAVASVAIERRIVSVIVHPLGRPGVSDRTWLRAAPTDETMDRLDLPRQSDLSRIRLPGLPGREPLDRCELELALPPWRHHGQPPHEPLPQVWYRSRDLNSESLAGRGF